MSSRHKLIYPLPTQESPENTNSDNILWDLGKATKRGTKKCPDCGYINGIRCYACKNPLCNRILKATDKHKVGVHIDSIKLVSGVTRQIYSVRVREKGGPDPNHPDQRGFVQLPCAIYESDRLSEVALCFVNHCERSYSILKCHENEDDDEDENENPTSSTLNFCVHIESAVKSLSVAHAIEFKHDLINNLRVCDDVKKKLCSLAKSTEGPLVQRIAKNVMAIKCFVNSANPLGYLHFILEFKKIGNSEDEIERFHCECNKTMKKCLHYYACVCAFASDAKLLHKFSNFVQHEFDSIINYDINTLLDEGKDNPYPLENIRIEILRPDLLGLPHLNRKSTNRLQKITSNRQNSTKPTKNAKQIQQIKVLSNELIKKPYQPNQTIETPTHCDNILEMLGYDEWLSSVIERINCSSATSHTSVFYNEHILDELCQPTILDVQEVKLEFHIPERFFLKFQSQLYIHTRNYSNATDENVCSSEFCSISTLHYAISNVAQLEHLFSLSNIKLASYQLLVNEQWLFRISWTGSVYKLCKFGELQLTFFRRHIND